MGNTKPPRSSTTSVPLIPTTCPSHTAKGKVGGEHIGSPGIMITVEGLFHVVNPSDSIAGVGRTCGDIPVVCRLTMASCRSEMLAGLVHSIPTTTKCSGARLLTTGREHKRRLVGHPAHISWVSRCLASHLRDSNEGK